MKTIKMTFNDYIETINRNNMFDLIDDIDYLLQHYTAMIGVDFNPDLATIEVFPSKSTMIISMPGVANYVARNSNYGLKNFSNF
jgi:hypothetical protein